MLKFNMLNKINIVFTEIDRKIIFALGFYIFIDNIMQNLVLNNFLTRSKNNAIQSLENVLNQV